MAVPDPPSSRKRPLLSRCKTADCRGLYGVCVRKYARKIHERKITLIGCPKLDDTDYAEKLTDIIRNNDVKSVTIVRMEVPCCGGLQAAAETALKNSGKFIPWNVAVISCDGKLLEE